MKTAKILFHMARADILERTRRYSFLIMLALVVWLAYASASQQIILRVPPDYVGEINSHWVGALMTLTVTLFLGWFGFYLVKGSVSRDYETGVGQIMATTPLSRPLYTLGKWLSNLAILSLMVFIVMVVGIMMNQLVGTGFNFWAIAAPLLIIALPSMALIAALAVLFETIRWLRGGLGNVIYFILFMIGIIPGIETDAYNPLLDFAGFRLIGDSIAQAASLTYPESKNGFAFSFTSEITPKYFPFDGIIWTSEVLVSRLFLLLLSIGIVMVAAVFFDRFNPMGVFLSKKRRQTFAVAPAPSTKAVPASFIRLTPLSDTHSRFRFYALFVAELKLILKGQRWWWYVIALGLVISQFANELEATRMLLVIAWVWPVLLLSSLGNREARQNTREIVFSAPRPVLYQLPATWLAGFAVIALAGSGALLKFLVSGETASIIPWFVGALFIPSLALACGVMTGTGKFFEVIYILWMYSVLQGVPALDFVGVTPSSPWQFYLALALLLLALSAFARNFQISNNNLFHRFR
jgi:hypothetical protein